MESVKIASLVAKCQADSAVAGKAADVFRAATVSGASAFGLDASEIRVGSAGRLPAGRSQQSVYGSGL